MSDMNDTSKRNERGGEGALSGMKARAGETLDAAREEAAHRAERGQRGSEQCERRTRCTHHGFDSPASAATAISGSLHRFSRSATNDTLYSRAFFPRNS